MKASFILPLVTLVVSSVPLFADVDDILQNTPTFKPKITLSDSYSEKVIAVREDGDVYRDVEVNPERIALSLTANLDGADPGDIDEDTIVGVTAGYFTHSDSLGDSIDYQPGGRKATFPFTMDVDRDDGSTKEVRVGTITYAWNAKVLTVTLMVTDIEGAGVDDIAASDYVDAPDDDEKIAIVDDPLDVTVDFGELSGERTVFVRGFAQKTTKAYGKEDDDDYEEFEIAAVNLQGSADVTGPAVKATFSSKPDAQKQVTVSGTATDVQAVSLVSVTLNNVVVPGATAVLSEPNAAGVYSWSVTGVTLAKGANALAVTFTDPDGNQTKVAKNYSVK